MKHAEFMEIFHRDYGTYIQALLSFLFTYVSVVKLFLSACGLYAGDPKNNRNYFLKWFINFYTTLVSFKVLSFGLDTLVPTFSPSLKTFLELFSVDVVQDLQRFLFHSARIIKITR